MVVIATKAPLSATSWASCLFAVAEHIINQWVIIVNNRWLIIFILLFNVLIFHDIYFNHA